MADRSKIEWTDASWTAIRAGNLQTGKVGWHCEHATTGCEHCYAEGMNKRLGTGLPFKPGHRKDIEIFLDEEMLTAPLRWKKPRRVFVCSMTDLFADFVEDEWIDRVFAVMALTPHIFQVLTKRPERMRKYLTGAPWGQVEEQAVKIASGYRASSETKAAMLADIAVNRIPLPNVWLGTSCERQQEADERIPLLLQTPAAVRFVSLEPLLGPIKLDPIDCGGGILWNALGRTKGGKIGCLDWVIVGGESGKGARPMHPDWARSLRDQCTAAGVAYFFKQWGEWRPPGPTDEYDTSGRVPGLPRALIVSADGTVHHFGETAGEGARNILRIGKKRAGRLLDGRTWDEFPKMEEVRR